LAFQKRVYDSTIVVRSNCRKKITGRLEMKYTAENILTSFDVPDSFKIYKTDSTTPFLYDVTTKMTVVMGDNGRELIVYKNIKDHCHLERRISLHGKNVSSKVLKAIAELNSLVI